MIAIIGSNGNIKRLYLSSGLIDLSSFSTIQYFTDLLDAPSTYVGQSLKDVRVNLTETGLEFYTPAPGISGVPLIIHAGDTYTVANNTQEINTVPIIVEPGGTLLTEGTGIITFIL